MPVYLHTAAGSLGSAESFAHGVHSGRTPGDIDQAHADFSAAMTLYRGATGVLGDYPTSVTWLRQTTRELDAAGNTVDMRESPLSVSGTSPQASLPFEVSMCVSERTAQAGGSGRGRMYLPPTTVTTMAAGNGLYSAAVVTRHLNAWAAALTSMLTAGSVPVVWSRTLLQDFPITTIAIGLVPDAQRRRRRSQEEAYQSAVV